jgi:hypothetical protein
MTRQFFKATRPDGTSFHDSTTRWEVGKTVRLRDSIPRENAGLCGPGVLHASDEPGETLISGSWPCRLFTVEGKPFLGPEGHKWGFRQLKVVEELPAWQALGPNGEAVAYVIEQTKTITPEQATQLGAAGGAAWGAAWGAARSAARGAAWNTARSAARGAAWSATRGAAWGAARNTARGAARSAAVDAAAGAVVRDLISDEHYQLLAGPWISVMGDPFEEIGA